MLKRGVTTLQREINPKNNNSYLRMFGLHCIYVQCFSFTGTVYMSCFNYWVSYYVILWATHKLYCRSVRVRLNTKLNLSANWRLKHLPWLTLYRNWMKSRYCLLFFWCFHIVQGGSNMTGTDLCVNKPHCAAAVRPWKSEATTSTLPPARVRTCSVLSGSC